MSVGLGHVAEAVVAADDGDGGVGQAGEVARHVAHMGAAAVFVVSEITHVVQTIFNDPVLPDQPQQFLGPGAVGVERGQAPGHLGAALAVLEALAFALDADRLAASVEVDEAVPFGAGDVDGGAAAALDPAMALVEGLEPRRLAPVDLLEVFEDGRLVVLDRGDHVVGVARLEQAARGLLLGMHRVDGDGASGELEARGQVAHGRDLVGLPADLHLPQDQAGAVLDCRDHHPPPAPWSAPTRRARPCRPWPPGPDRRCAGWSTG